MLTGETVCEFIEKWFRLPEDNPETNQKAGDKITLLPWQRDRIYDLYSINKDTGRRLYNVAFIEIPKKNAKTALLAWICLVELILGRKASQLLGAARTREQAGHLFRAAKNTILFSPGIRNILTVSERSGIIKYEKKSSFYKIVATVDSATIQGWNCRFAVVDELHSMPDLEAWESIRSGTIAHPDGMLVGITTAGHDKTSAGWQLHEYALKCKEKPDTNPKFYSCIYGLTESDDWHNESNWYKANPALGHILNIERFRSEHHAALSSKHAEFTFKRYFLNIWTQELTQWIKDDVWVALGNDDIKMEDFRDVPLYVGVDLASTDDLTAISAVFVDGAKHTVFPMFFVPENLLNFNADRHNQPYRDWMQHGWLKTTPGDNADHDCLIDYIRQTFDGYNLRYIAYDRYQGTQFGNMLTKYFPQPDDPNEEFNGTRVVQMACNPFNISSPSKRVERLINAKQLQHNNSPVMRWNVKNAKIKIDNYGNLWPEKQGNKYKIDGVYATIIAVSQVLLDNKEPVMPDFDLSALSKVKI